MKKPSCAVNAFDLDLPSADNAFYLPNPSIQSRSNALPSAPSPSSAVKNPLSSAMPTHFKVPRSASDENLTWDVIALLYEKADFYKDEATYRASIAPATPGQLAIYACGWYLEEVLNGGHDQFFSNNTGMVWRDALNGFKLLGAEPYSAILAEALKKFPSGQPAMDRDDRESQLAAIGADAWDDLDQQVYDLDPVFDDYARKFILAHPAEFFTNP
jgi:hypothetical protein